MNAVALPTDTVLIDGLRIRYADSGAGGPIILLTSPWPESLFAFRRIWPALARTARLVAMDLPGFGHSESRSDVFTPSAMGEFLLRFIAVRGRTCCPKSAFRCGSSAPRTTRWYRCRTPATWLTGYLAAS